MKTAGWGMSLVVQWLGLCSSNAGERKVKVAQSCPILCNPMDYTVHGILQARILAWVAVPFSRESSEPRDWTQVSRISGGFFTSFPTEWVAYPFSRGSSWPRNWTRASCIAGGFFTSWAIREAQCRGPGLIPGWGTKIPHMAWCGHK